MITKTVSFLPHGAGRQAVLNFWANFFTNRSNLLEHIEGEKQAKLPHVPKNIHPMEIAGLLGSLDCVDEAVKIANTANIGSTILMRVEQEGDVVRYVILDENRDMVGSASSAVIMTYPDLLEVIKMCVKKKFTLESLVNCCLDGDFSLPNVNGLSITHLVRYVTRELLPWIGGLEGFTEVGVPRTDYGFLRYSERAEDVYLLWDD